MPYENWSDPLSQFDGGGGYNFRAGMSNNAVEAYGRGAKPISRITLANLREAGWTETKKLALLLEKKGFWSSCEWHHSGGTWYNRVNFYDPENLVEEWDELSEQEKQSIERKWNLLRKRKRVAGSTVLTSSGEVLENVPIKIMTRNSLVF